MAQAAAARGETSLRVMSLWTAMPACWGEDLQKDAATSTRRDSLARRRVGLWWEREREAADDPGGGARSRAVRAPRYLSR